MRGMQAHLDTLRAETTNCERIAKLATDTGKRDLFTKLAQHYKILASEVERAIKIQSRIIKPGIDGGDKLRQSFNENRARLAGCGHRGDGGFSGPGCPDDRAGRR